MMVEWADGEWRDTLSRTLITEDGGGETTLMCGRWVDRVVESWL